MLGPSEILFVCFLTHFTVPGPNSQLSPEKDLTLIRFREISPDGTTATGCRESASRSFFSMLCASYSQLPSLCQDQLVWGGTRPPGSHQSSSYSLPGFAIPEVVLVADGWV